MSNDVTRQVTITATSQGVDDATAKLTNLAKAQDGVAVASDRSAKATESMQRKVDALQRSIDADFRAKEKLAQVEATLNRAREQGLVSIERQQQLMARAQTQYAPRQAVDTADADLRRRAEFFKNALLPMEAEMERTRAHQREIVELGNKRLLTQKEVNDALQAEALRHDQSKRSIEGMYIVQGKYASGVGLARNEVVNLSRQLQDVAVTLQAGQPLSTILMQQGTQIFDIFTASDATFRGLVTQVGQGARTLMTSFAGIAGSALAVGAALTWVGTRYGDAQREVERQVNGIGRASGTTVAEINRIAESTANLQRVSVSTAREFAGIFAGTGRIGTDNNRLLTGITRDFAAQTGESDLTKAAQELAKAFSGDVVKAAEELNQKLGFLDNRTRSYIETLADQGNRQAAIRATIEAMNGSVNGAAERVNWLTRAWQGLTTAASNAVDAVGNAVAGQVSLERQLADLEARRASLQASRLYGGGRGTERARQLDEEILKTRLLIEGQRRLAENTSAQAQAARLSNEVGQIARQADPAAERLREMRAELEKVRRFMGDQRATAAFGDLAPAVRAMEALNNAVQTFLTSAERVSAETSIQVRQVLARTAAEQLSVSLDRERLAMAGQVVTEKEREARLQQQIAVAQANAAREQRDAIRQLRDEAAAAGQTPFARRQVEDAIFRRNLNERTNVPANNNTPGFQSYGPFMVPNAGAAAMAARAAGGLDPAFAARVQALIEAVNDSGARMTSGFRTREEQAALYERYGPGRAAAPGSSQHERGTAADYTFSSADARRRAMEMAPQFGLRALSSNGGAVHFDAGAVRAHTGAVNDNVRALQAQRNESEFIRGPMREYGVELEQQRRALALQEQAQTLSVRAMASAQREQEILNNFQRQGVTLNEEQRRAVKALADAHGELVQRQQSLRLTRDLQFEREQMFRSPVEQQVASRMRSTFGDSYQSMMSGVEAQMARLNAQMDQFGRIGEQAFDSIAQGFIQGRDAGEIFSGVLRSIAGQIAQMAVQSLWRSAAPSLFGLLGGGGGLFGGAAAAPILNPLGFMFDQGGYTGAGGRLDPAGIVHRGEYVFSAPAVSRAGVGTLERMHRSLKGYSDGGYVGPAPHGVANDRGGPAAGVTIQGSTIVIQGSADQTTIAAFQAALDARDKRNAQSFAAQYNAARARGAIR